MDTVRAWKDPEYRWTLERTSHHAHLASPAGDVAMTSLSDGEIAEVVGGGTGGIGTLGCCRSWTFYTACSLVCVATATICGC
jgi:mersacidin/lichenicidin family type 2 lantibiotic